MLDTTSPALLALNKINRDTIWTEEKIAQLHKLYAEGCSAGVIGERMNLTRNTIMGKINRLGLNVLYPRRPNVPPRFSINQAYSPEERAAREHARRQAVEERRRRQNAVSLAHYHANPRSSKPTPVEPPVLACDPCSLLELNEVRCKWPMGEVFEPGFRFCGAHKPDNGKPYCLSHHRIAHDPPKTKRTDHRSVPFLQNGWGGK